MLALALSLSSPPLSFPFLLSSLLSSLNVPLPILHLRPSLLNPSLLSLPLRRPPPPPGEKPAPRRKNRGSAAWRTRVPLNGERRAADELRLKSLSRTRDLLETKEALHKVLSNNYHSAPPRCSGVSPRPRQPLHEGCPVRRRGTFDAKCDLSNKGPGATPFGVVRRCRLSIRSAVRSQCADTADLRDARNRNSHFRPSCH